MCTVGRLLRSKWTLPGVIAFVSLAAAACAGQESPTGTQEPAGPTHSKVYHAEGTNVWIVGGYGDNMTYSGEKYTPTNGLFTLDVNDETNEGKLVAEWEVEDWKYDASRPPATGTMKIIWTDFFGEADFMEGGIASDLILHGNSGQEAPVLPTVYSYSAGWGSAETYLDDQLIYSDIIAHYMVTEGTRDPDTHAVHESDGMGKFVPSPKGGDSGNGFVYPDQLIMHVVVHTEVRDPNNWPPFTMFMHVNFEDPTVPTVSRKPVNRAPR